MGTKKKKAKGAERTETSAASTPTKDVGSPKASHVSKEDQTKIIEELQKKLAAASKHPKGKSKRSAIGTADSSTDDEEQAEAAEEPAEDAERTSASCSKSGSTSSRFSKLGNRANKAKKLFKDQDEEAEYRAWKASKAAPVTAVPVQPVVPVQSDEAIARFFFCSCVFLLSDCFLLQSVQFYESCGPRDPLVPVLGPSPGPPDDAPSRSSP